MKRWVACFTGREDVLSFLSEIGIDSIVQTRQLTQQSLTFELIFNLLPPKQIIGAVEQRFAAGDAAGLKILEGQSLTERDDAALSSFSRTLLSVPQNCHQRKVFAA